MKEYVGGLSERKSLFVTIMFAFLVPGGGHLYLGKKVRFLLIFVFLTGLSLLGLQFSGTFFIPQGEMSGEIFANIFIFLSIVVQLFNGVFYLILAGFNSSRHMHGMPGMMEIGGTFIIIAGLLNMLIMMDAYDVAVGKKG